MMKKTSMNIQKIYTSYTIALWILWILILFLTEINGTVFDVKNEQLRFILIAISIVINLISIIPVIPVLWLIALVKAIRNREYKHINFNLISIAISVLLWVYFLINNIVLLIVIL